MVPISSLGENYNFDYLTGIHKNIKVGDIVKVPFSNKGLIWGVVRNKKLYSNNTKLKTVVDISELPSLSSNYLKFIDWVAEWTMASPGSVLKLALSVPSAFDPIKQKTVWTLSPICKNLKTVKEVILYFNKIKITQNRQKILNSLFKTKVKSSSELINETGVSLSVIKTLEKNKLIQKTQSLRTEHYLFELPITDFNKVDLTKDQVKASDLLVKHVKMEDFRTILLDGVTGSGKTEVYFEAVAAALNLNKQVLILLPEISLSFIWIERFKKRFGVKPAEWHSNLTPKVRRETWRELSKGQAKIVVGARSALFLPLPNLGLVIVDEEHDHSFKQEEGVLYNARDMALIRSKLFKCPIILSSATPSLETWSNSRNKKYSTVKLQKRIGEAQMPTINLIDMRTNSALHGSWISNHLEMEILENFKKKELVLLFLNRRGYAPLTLCKSCGFRLSCEFCKSWLVEHRSINNFLCHQCGYLKKIKSTCDSCGEENSMISCGPGVERLKEEISLKFPEAKTEILSSDTIQNPESLNQFIKKINDQSIDLIIGTQIVAKGHNFRRLTLVGIIDGDISLSGGDLRASEKTFQLLQQVSGRSGRENLPGKVFIQTYDPENDVMKALQKNNRDDFLKIEALDRQESQMPPFGRLAAIIISSKNESILDFLANKLAVQVPKFKDVIILGPAPAPVAIIRGRHRRRFLIKTSKNVNIQKVIKVWISSIKVHSSVKLAIDIEPYTFM